MKRYLGLRQRRNLNMVEKAILRYFKIVFAKFLKNLKLVNVLIKVTIDT